MPLQETLDTFTYFISEADKLKLSYIALVRYIPSKDVEIDGKALRSHFLPTSFALIHKTHRQEACDSA